MLYDLRIVLFNYYWILCHLLFFPFWNWNFGPILTSKNLNWKNDNIRKRKKKNRNKSNNENQIIVKWSLEYFYKHLLAFFFFCIVCARVWEAMNTFYTQFVQVEQNKKKKNSNRESTIISNSRINIYIVIHKRRVLIFKRTKAKSFSIWINDRRFSF